MRVQGFVVGVAFLMFAGAAGCGPDTDTRPREKAPSATSGPASATKNFDPLQFEEPQLPPVPRGVPTAQQMSKALEFVASAYTWGLRTGFSSPDLRALGCGCGLPEEIETLRKDGLHVVTGPVRMRVLKRTQVVQLQEGQWAITIRAEFMRPAGTVQDANGDRVDSTTARSWIADVTLSVITGQRGRWFVLNWQEV